LKIFITGATGTLGRELVKQLWERPDVERIVVYSRGEQRQVEMGRDYPEYPTNRIRYMIGDIRSISRLVQAMQGCTHAIHAAALKHVPVCEYNPQEAIKTNVFGTENFLDACNLAGIKKAIVVSTDKAVEPVTLYGSTKLCAERLAIAGNNLGHCRFAVVRYANVEGSNGSAIQVWEKQIKEKQPVTITNKEMTRMWIKKQRAAAFVLWMLDEMEGGEVFVPECTRTAIYDMAKSVIVGSNEAWGTYPIVETGIRPNEKMHEILISEADARDCRKRAGYYVCYPASHDWCQGWERYNEGEKMPDHWRYCSNGK
jgi:UDP-N-acetylglucosamine 4,6-dehydratase